MVFAERGSAHLNRNLPRHPPRRKVPKKKVPRRPPKWKSRRRNVTDWRNHRGINAVTPAKDQAGCGACVAFSFVGLLESMLVIEHGLVTDLSEAEFYFCGGGNCSGWSHVTAINRALSAGAVRENVLPYTGTIQHCPTIANRAFIRIKATNNASFTNNNERKAYLDNVGPMVACFYVYPDFDSYYWGGSGIYSHIPDTGNKKGKEKRNRARGSHCVLVIGYDDFNRCWICKNSWGMTGPENNGIFRMDYDSNCNFENSEFLGLYGMNVAKRF
jgi:C1A family cysteine protease